MTDSNTVRIHRQWLLVALLAAGLLGCGGDEGSKPVADAAPIDTDALAGCIDQQSVEIGRCLLPDQTPCTSVTDPSPGFHPLPGSDTSVSMVVGFQNATMFALALRTSAIYPGVDGNPDDDPLVSVSLFNEDDVQVSNYFRRLRFEPVVGDPSTYEMLYVFLLVAGATQDLVGQTLTARALITDKDDKLACGEALFVGADL